MTTKERLHHLIDGLDDTDAADALDYVEWLLAPEDELTADELEQVIQDEAAIARGEYVTLDELRRSLGR